MKKALIAILAVCALCFGMVTLVGCGGSTDSNNSNILGSDGKFTVGFDKEFPPYGYVGDDGNYTGFDLDLAAEVAKRNGWQIEYKPIDWDGKDLELDSGSIDCIWNGFTIEGREDGYTWTDPYMDNSQVIVTRSDSGITKLSDLAGKVVMAQADSAAYHLLADDDGGQKKLGDTFKKLQTTPDYQQAFMELESGAVDAVAIDKPVAAFETSGKESTYTILSEQLNTEHYGVGFKKNDANATQLRDKVESTLKEMVKDGTVKTICDKYADQGISYDSWILGK